MCKCITTDKPCIYFLCWGTVLKFSSCVFSNFIPSILYHANAMRSRPDRRTGIKSCIFNWLDVNFWCFIRLKFARNRPDADLFGRMVWLLSFQVSSVHLIVFSTNEEKIRYKIVTFTPICKMIILCLLRPFAFPSFSLQIAHVCRC